MNSCRQPHDTQIASLARPRPVLICRLLERVEAVHKQLCWHRKRFRLFGVFPSHSGEFNDVDCRWRKRLRNDRDNCVLCNSFHFEDGFCLPQGLTLQNVITTPFGFAAKNDFVRSAFCVLLYYKKKRINLGLALFDAHLQVIHLHDFASTR